MKKLSFLFLTMAAMSTAFVSCSKDDPAPVAPVTSLELTILDGFSQTANPGVTVKLYDPASTVKPAVAVATGTTDTNGKIKFSNLKPIIYTFSAIKDCQNNLWLNSSTEDAITAGTTTSLVKYTESTGFLLIKNNSTDRYKISFQDAGDNNKDITWLPPVSTNTTTTTGDINGYPYPIPSAFNYRLKLMKLDASGNDTTEITFSTAFTVTCSTSNSPSTELTTVDIP